MTPQEVIDILKMFTTDKFQRCTSSEFDDAIYTAIEALKLCEWRNCESDCKTCRYRCRAWQNGYNAKREKMWIPVSEKLPKDDRLVLVTVSGVHNNTIFDDALELGSYDKDGWLIEGWLDWVNPKVTAWIPLPESFKED